MKHIIVAMGTRPEAIKLAPVVFALRSCAQFRTTICSTGQQREMLNDAMRFFGLEPQHTLDVMRENQALSAVTARMITGLDALFSSVSPSLVVVQGDTTTTFCSALAAFYHRIPIAHVEAGLRTLDRYSPFPEEVNRVLTTHLSDHHFAPTPRARANLVREGVSLDRIHVVGNTVIDALTWASQKLGNAMPPLVGPEPRSIDFSRRLVLVTCHRRESFGAPLARICRALSAIAEEPDVQIVFPVHLNPNVQVSVHALLSDRPNIHLLPPQPYAVMVALLKTATLVLTDSGGIQEEAPAFGKPVLVMREVTERPEAVEAGVARIVGTSDVEITTRALELLRDPVAYRSMALRKQPFGDGHSAQRIAEILGTALA